MWIERSTFQTLNHRQEPVNVLPLPSANRQNRWLLIFVLSPPQQNPIQASNGITASLWPGSKQQFPPPYRPEGSRLRLGYFN